uniref:NADH-ubiquinone oxidoreductase chain 3 n=1 Tax=Brachionus calyciflorus TaxID=104777 RepID=A0A1Q1MMG4_9BILA|nr:NADH dehydrogenase subunit 3 [Brachionus calyciflorus]QHN89974.1 NADH dehydrogenase subunit 3 [Brachionus calyciflorus]UBY46740.1 NADH dehydrogenase subunit 3 [Brachionus calyciflorus]
MLMVLYLVITSSLLVIFLKIVSLMIAESSPLNREELTPYECGFEHHNVSRVPFSLRYFFLTLIFLLFDLEIVLMLFMPYVILSNFFALGLVLLTLFVFILYLSLIYEWNDGTLEWLS